MRYGHALDSQLWIGKRKSTVMSAAKAPRLAVQGLNLGWFDLALEYESIKLVWLGSGSGSSFSAAMFHTASLARVCSSWGDRQPTHFLSKA